MSVGYSFMGSHALDIKPYIQVYGLDDSGQRSTSCHETPYSTCPLNKKIIVLKEYLSGRSSAILGSFEHCQWGVRIVLKRCLSSWLKRCLSTIPPYHVSYYSEYQLTLTLGVVMVARDGEVAHRNIGHHSST